MNTTMLSTRSLAVACALTLVLSPAACSSPTNVCSTTQCPDAQSPDTTADVATIDAGGDDMASDIPTLPDAAGADAPLPDAVDAADASVVDSASDAGGDAIAHPLVRPDPTFAGGGTAMFSSAGRSGWRFNACAVALDGSVVAVGTTGWEALYARLDHAGALDTAFGGTGYVTRRYSSALVSSADASSDVDIQTDGRIVAVTGSNVVRLTTGGVHDSTFDADGIAVPNTGVLGAGLRRIVLMTDNRILVGGSVAESLLANWWETDHLLARYQSNGSPDASFDGDGVLFLSFGPGQSEVVEALTVDTSNRPIVGARPATATGGTRTFRLTSAGALDATFGTGGVFTFDASINDVTDVLQVPGGDVIGITAGVFFGVTPAGGLATGFGTGGSLLPPAGCCTVSAAVRSNREVWYQHTDPGCCGPMPQTLWAISPDGVPLTTGPAASLPLPSDGSNLRINDVCVGADGAIVVVGNIEGTTAATSGAFVARFIE